MKITTYLFILSALLFWNCQPNNTIPESNTINSDDSSEESNESSESSSNTIESSESSSTTTDESSEGASSQAESSNSSSSEAEPEDQPSSSDESSTGTSSESSSPEQSSQVSSSSSQNSSSMPSSSSIASSSSVSPIATGTLHVEFQPVTYEGEYFWEDNANIYAVFITAEDGTYIKTIEARANKRIEEFRLWTDYLDGEQPDGITGATVENHDKRIIDWNLKDRDNQKVDKGIYYLHMAYTEDDYSDKHPGVEHSTQFIISSEETTITDNNEFFEDISIVHTP